MIKYIFVLFFTVLSNLSYSQNEYIHFLPINVDTTKVNKYNENHEKHGVWINQPDSRHITINFYVNGKKNGLERSYTKNYKGKFFLDYLMCYDTDTLKGQWVRFDQSGNGDYLFVVDSTRNSTQNIEQARSIWPNAAELRQSYLWNFKNGLLKEEGWCVYIDYLEEDSYEVGDWKVYNEDGSISLEKRGEKHFPNFVK